MSHRAEFIVGMKSLLNADTQAKIDHWVAKFPPENKRSALIQALLAAQDQNGGWVNKDVIEAVADYLEMPPVWAYEVVSFYSMFDRNRLVNTRSISAPIFPVGSMALKIWSATWKTNWVSKWVTRPLIIALR